MITAPLVRAFLLLPLLGAPAFGTSVAPADEGDLGASLFARHCAACHGEDGRAQGSIPHKLRPRPRDFGSGLFRIVRTENGAPTDDDLLGVLRRGMPGSSMPAFSWMPEEHLRALVKHVRRLAIDGLTETITNDVAWWEGRSLDPEDARRMAIERLTPGAVLDGVAGLEPTSELRDRGARLYGMGCQACHGPDGRGLAVRPRWSDGDPIWARDFTAGVMKGGATHADLVRRIRAGLPGSGMPPTKFDRPDDADAVALHVKSLLRAGAEDRLVRKRQSLVAQRVERVPLGLGDRVWDEGAEASVVLAPMVWSDRAVLEAAVAAIHDGENVAVRVRWEDGSHDADLLRGVRLPDAVAIQWTPDIDAPLFGMGAEDHPHDIWLWRAYRPDDAPGLLDLLEAARAGAVSPDVGYAGPHGLPARGEALRAEGFGSDVTIESTGRTLDVAAEWRDGIWTIVFRRALRVDEEAAAQLDVGGQSAIAFAVWNGSAGDAGMRKSITIWHELTLEE